MASSRTGKRTTRDLRPLAILLAVAIVAMAAVAGLRAGGWLRTFELAGHDLLVTLARHVADRPDAGVIVLGIDERDKAALGWPLPDRVVTNIIEKLRAFGPAAVGLDFFRGDMPVGPLGLHADPAEMERLADLLVASPDVVAIVDTFRPTLPPLLAGLAAPGTDRLASPNLPPDRDQVLRRGILGDVFPDPEVAEPTTELWSLSAALVRIATRNDRLELPKLPDDVVPLGRRAVAPLNAWDGPYAGSPEVGAGYEFLASWPVLELPTIRLADLLEGRVDPALVRNRIVLVGAVARSVGDVLTSPILDHASATALPDRAVFGVEAHAQLTAQLLQEARGQVPPLRPTPSSWWLLALILATLLGAAAGGLVATPLLSLPLLLLGSFVWPALALLTFVQGFWVAWVPAMLGWLLAAILGFVLVGWRERRQRARLSSLFRTYLPPSVADALWTERGSLLEDGRPVPRAMVATVLFSDVRGFTTVSEGMTPRDLLGWLESFHELMADCIAAHGGIVADFMGDGMMAVFGVPVPSEDEQAQNTDAQAALSAALLIRARLPLLSERMRRSGRPGIAIRIGIHTGPVIAGAIGSRARLQYTVLGDTVNTAARLESLSSPDLARDEDHCRILVSEATLRHVGGNGSAVPVGALPLKGKTRPVFAFRIVDEGPRPAGV